MNIARSSGDSHDLIGSEKSNAKRYIFIFALMFFSFFSFNLVGKFLLVEIFFLCILLLNVLRRKIAITTSSLKPFIGLLIFALISQIITDLALGTPTVSMIKGFSLILFTLTNLYGISLLTKFKAMDVRIALLGYSLGGLAGYFLQPSTYARSEIWKFGVGYPVTLTLFVLLSFTSIKRFRLLVLALLLLLSAVSLVQGARSLALFTILPFCFLNSKKSKIKVKNSKTIWSLLIASIVTSTFILMYSNLAVNGTLGTKAQSKYLTQTTSGGNLISNSRSELIFAAQGIIESPILGNGSYAKMNPELKMKILHFLDRNGIYYDLVSLNRIYGDRIPAHSMILQWWLWFGIMGMLFPLRLGFLTIKSLRIPNREPVFYYLAISGMWNVLFSPYGENYRVLVPLTIVTLISLGKTRSMESTSHG